MYRTITTVLMLCAIFLVKEGFSQSANLQQMNNWLADRNFFALKKALSIANTQLSVQDSLYFEASVQNAFGENSASIQTIGQLSDHFATKLEDGAWINLINILADNYAKNSDYKSAAACYAILLQKYRRKLDRQSIDGYENSYALYHALENTPPQSIRFRKTVPVQMLKDQVGLWNVPVNINGQDTSRFIFDSGAGISTISASAAQKLRLEILPVGINVNSATSKQVKAQLGVARELEIGGIFFENVVFLVMEDATLQFPSIQYRIDGIIGFPVIHDMRKITIGRTGVLRIFPGEKDVAGTPDFFYQGNAIRMQGITGADTLLFHLDTGAKQSELGKAYYDAHKSAVRSTSEKRKYHLGSAGGVTAYKTYQLPHFALQVGGGKGTLDYIPVYPDKVSEYGNAIGQDYIQLFDEMLIDFENCFITFR